MRRIARRDFLRYASAAGAVARVAAATGDPSPDGGAQIATADVRISAADYAPVPDYPIRPQRHSNVRMADQFWKPRILRNAEVTIPFEMQKLAEMERGFSVNVLEAAILSLAMHPDVRLQAEVDAQVLRLQQSLGFIAADSRHGGAHRFRRPWPAAWRRQRLSSQGPRGPDDLTRASFKVQVSRSRFKSQSH
jgi:hypothetical protein